MQQSPHDTPFEALPEYADSMLQEMGSTLSPGFERIWDQFHELLKDYVQNRLSPQLQPEAGASDILQSAFLSLWRRLEDKSKPALTEQDDLWGFLMTLARRKLARRWREINTQKRGSGKVVTATDFTNGDANTSFDEIVFHEVNHQVRLELEEASQRLDLECQTIVSMKLAGMTNAEISKALNCSTRRIERKNNLIRISFSDPDETALVPPAS
ncbi:MAG: hypothetical protein CME31_28330 [Gimesia sp.]|jgi:RNA polymerase sigma factor (sigma-70 family)|uniref:RNA polymerase sigma-70 ECF-like HTH domain-containing protein n=1 Tax=Gimesia maris TaxID=122 RepID=A0A3D3R0B4_9PLAN|nr:hypothetical protein [Gimesia sp.]HCO22284.1 hypothetical protein [Gimesia maris]|tara:strand:+ start:23521 stop:24159 length:639 start_codon:yes stop_codon:yes gene_type:complete